MPYITNCPTCQCRIVANGVVTKSHETYTDCIEALIEELTKSFDNMLYALKRIISVMRLEIVKRKKLESELNKVTG